MVLVVPQVAGATPLVSNEIPASYRAERTPVYHAFIFANDGYKALTPIPSAAKDFTLMRDFFDRYHYREWIIGGNGRIQSVEAFYRFMNEAREEIQPGDVVVIYYSGHGFYYGNQNWLVPLDYPAGPVNPQRLFETAIGLSDVINGLAEKRVDYVVTILDSCRTTVQFPMAGDASAGKAEVPDPLVAGFSFSGPSLIAWMVGTPTQVGGQALGTSSVTEPSLYTGILAASLAAHTKLNEVQSALRSAVHDLVLAGKVNSTDISPRFASNDSNFNFSPQVDPIVAAKQARDWTNVMREPSKRLVSDYLTLNPGSSYSTAAWKYIDDHVVDPIDPSSGSTATDAEKVEAAFTEGRDNGKLIAIATPGFTVKFPRNALGHEPTSAKTIADAIVYADRDVEIPAILAQRYSEKGSKLNFDVSQLQGAGSLKADAKQLARPAPGNQTKVIAEFDNSTSYKIDETFLETANDTLFARVQTGLNGEPVSEGAWVTFGNDPKAPAFNVLNRALDEVYVSSAGLVGRPSEETVADATAAVRKTSNQILWVSIAVDDQTIDLAPLQEKLKGAPNDGARAEINTEIERASESNRRALAAANLRSLDARLQLIDAGIDGTRISIAGDKTGNLGEGVRLRYFGSR